MAQSQKLITEEAETPYRSELSGSSDETRSAVSRADTLTGEERRAMNQPGRAAFGDALTGEIPPGARHVRPEELVNALSAIEARKGEAVVGVQPLGIALLRANASVSAEAVWEEIQKQREQRLQSANARKTRLRKRPQLWWKIGAGIACLGATIFSLSVLLRDMRVVQEHLDGPQNNPFAVKGQTVTQELPNVAYDLMYVDRPGMVSLANLPEGKPFFMSTMQAQQLDGILNGNDFTRAVPKEELKEFFVSLDDFDSGIPWETVIEDGKVYIRGWVSIPPGTPQADILNKYLEIYNRPPASGVTTQSLRQITFPIGATSSVGTTSTNGFATMTVMPKYLDRNAWGPWTPLPPPRSSRNAVQDTYLIGAGKTLRVHLPPRPPEPNRAPR